MKHTIRLNALNLIVNLGILLFALTCTLSMHRNLSISSWNMNCNSGIASPFLNELMKHSNFIAISEHGLYECELFKLGKYNNNFDYLGKAYKNLINDNHGHKRGHGGCALLWHKDVSAHVRPLPELGSDRICVVEFTNGNFKCFIISVYLPYDDCKIAEFKTELHILESVIHKCNKNAEIVIIGDTNSHINGIEFGDRGWGRNTPNGTTLKSFAKRNALRIIDLERGTGPAYTFRNHRGMSYIDHCLISEGLDGLVTGCKVIPDIVDNVSDHLAINVTVNSFYIPVNINHGQPRVAWSKLNPEIISTCYTRSAEELILNLLTAHEIDPDKVLNGNCEYFDDYEIDINAFVKSLTDCLHRATSDLPKSRFHKAYKPYWDKELTDLSKARKLAKRNWDMGGNSKDSSNQSNIIYRESKRAFRNYLRRKQYEYEKQEMSDLCKSQEMNEHFFWHLIKKHRNKVNCVTPIQNDEGVTLTDPSDIRTEWNRYYEQLYSCQEDSSYDENFKNLIEEELNEILANTRLTGKLKGGDIKIDEIKKQISKMKTKKAAGWDQLTSEHLKNLGDLGVGTLTFLMNYMVKTKCIPQYLKRGLIVPIPKPGKDSSIKDQNRGLTLLPTIYKLFEMVILDRERKWLCENNIISDLQGAAQESCSSAHVSLLLQETINYNLSKGENVYIAFLDIKKAFDTVWVSGLIYKLFKLGMDPMAVCLISESFKDFQCTAYIAGETGTWFKPQRGVHQGAPLSMTLYEIYINELLQELKACPFGLCLMGLNVNCPSYADDISTGTLSKTGLNQILRIANDYQRKWRYAFSPEKCIYMVWGTDTMPNLSVKLGNSELQKVESTKHMGIMLTSVKNTKGIICERIGKARRSLFAARGLGSTNVPVTPNVLSKIYNSVSIPRMLYGYEATYISEHDTNELEQAHRYHAKLVQGLPQNVPTPSALAPLGWLSIKAQLAIKKLIFLWRILTFPHGNIYRRLVMFIMIMHMQGITQRRSPIMQSLDLAEKYGLYGKFISAMFSSTPATYLEGKNDIKKRVKEKDKDEWRASCMMYGKLNDLYFSAQQNLYPNIWYKISNALPHLSQNISHVMALIMGSQPKGMQHNFTMLPCQLCELHEIESPSHVLLRCGANQFHQIRENYWRSIKSEMPHIMREHVNNLNDEDKTRFILTGLGGGYVSEWLSIYSCIAIYVTTMYKLRDALYKEPPD